MKLELHHITPYADKAVFGTFNGVRDILTDIDFVNGLVSSLNNGSVELENFKLELRPLSDLLKNGYSFVWSSETDVSSLNQWLYLDAETKLGDKFSYEFWCLLFENHFDIFGLIEKGLAIDINTLK